MLLSCEKITAISHLRVTASWGGVSARRETSSAVYNPPPGFVVMTTETIVHSSNNGSREISVIAGGLDLVTETDLNEVYRAAIDFAASRSDDNLKAKLEDKRNQHIREVRRFQSSHNTVLAIVRAKAHGSVVNRKRGWEEISVIAELIQLGAPGKEDVAAALEDEFAIDIPGF